MSRKPKPRPIVWVRGAYVVEAGTPGAEPHHVYDEWRRSVPPVGARVTLYGYGSCPLAEWDWRSIRGGSSRPKHSMMIKPVTLSPA